MSTIEDLTPQECESPEEEDEVEQPEKKEKETQAERKIRLAEELANGRNAKLKKSQDVSNKIDVILEKVEPDNHKELIDGLVEEIREMKQHFTMQHEVIEKMISEKQDRKKEKDTRLMVADQFPEPINIQPVVEQVDPAILKLQHKKELDDERDKRYDELMKKTHRRK